MRYFLALAVCSLVAAPVAAPAQAQQKAAANRLSYHDGKADGKKSLGSSGEIVAFRLPAVGQKVSGIRIHGSRYGQPEPPKEDFEIYFLDPKTNEIVATELGKVSKFNRGPEKWVQINFDESLAELPQDFKVVLNFHAQQTKGVYVSYDTSTEGKYSEVGLPGKPLKPTDSGGDWMIELVLAK